MFESVNFGPTKAFFTPFWTELISEAEPQVARNSLQNYGKKVA